MVSSNKYKTIDYFNICFPSNIYNAKGYEDKLIEYELT